MQVGLVELRIAVWGKKITEQFLLEKCWTNWTKM